MGMVNLSEWLDEIESGPLAPLVRLVAGIVFYVRLVQDRASAAWRILRLHFVGTEYHQCCGDGCDICRAVEQVRGQVDDKILRRYEAKDVCLSLAYLTKSERLQETKGVRAVQSLRDGSYIILVAPAEFQQRVRREVSKLQSKEEMYKLFQHNERSRPFRIQRNSTSIACTIDKEHEPVTCPEPSGEIPLLSDLMWRDDEIPSEKKTRRAVEAVMRLAKKKELDGTPKQRLDSAA